MRSTHRHCTEWGALARKEQAKIFRKADRDKAIMEGLEDYYSIGDWHIDYSGNIIHLCPSGASTYANKEYCMHCSIKVPIDIRVESKRTKLKRMKGKGIIKSPSSKG